MLGPARELHDVEHVRRSGNHRACDLSITPAHPRPVARPVEPVARRIALGLGCFVQARRIVRQRGAIPEQRSEERRVGKECRSRRAPYHAKKKTSSGTLTVGGATGLYRVPLALI